MTKHEYENLKSHFGVLQARMDERDDDCAEPRNAIDEGYHLAVSHMKSEIKIILADLGKQING